MSPDEPSDLAQVHQTDQTDLSRINQALIRVWRGTKQRMAGRSSRLEGAGYMLLGCLTLAEPARLSDLATMLRLDASTVSRQVRALEEAGLVHREPDPGDRRATRLLLSEPGRTELRLQHHERNAALAAATSSWTEVDRETLMTLLERLAADLESPAPSRASPPTSPGGRTGRADAQAATPRRSSQAVTSRRSTDSPESDASLTHAVRKVSYR